MSDEQTVTLKESETLQLSCPKCGPGTIVTRVFVDLRRGMSCVQCKCGQAIQALGLDKSAYTACVQAKLDQGEPSRIVKPGPVRVKPN